MCYPGSNSSVPLCADSFAGWCLAPFYSIAQEWSVFRDKFCTVTQRQPFCSVLCFTLKLYYTSRKQRFCQNFWIPPLKNCLQSGSFWVSQSHFFKGDRKVIALAAFEMRGCQSSRPRTSVGNTFRFFCRESYWLGQNTVRARPQFWRVFKRIRGFSVKKGLLSVYSESVLTLAPAFRCLSVPFHRCTHKRAHTHIFPYLFCPYTYKPVRLSSPLSSPYLLCRLSTGCFIE